MKNEISSLKEYCDTQELLTILENWSNGTGLSSIVVDNDGIPVTKSYGMSPFCAYIQASEEGRKRCHDNWKDKVDGLHQCHSGFYDFSIPLILPDGTEIGKVLAGQMRSEDQSVDEILLKLSDFVDDKDKVRSILSEIPAKSKNEIQASYKLLKQMIVFFLEKSYASYQEKAARKHDVDMLTAALKTVYRISMLFNVTKNEYHLIDYKPGVGMVVPQSGTIDEIVEIGVKSIPDKKQARKYYDMFNRDAIIKSYKSGTRELVLQHKQTIYNGEVHWMEGRMVFVDSASDEIHCVCISKVIDDEIQNKMVLKEALANAERQSKLLQEALDNYKQADYDRRRDFLTGLRNRQDMFELFNDALSGKRNQIKAMFMMDIDNFKSLNDMHGHTYGDECLQKIGAALNKYGDKNDMYFYRYGGEEMLGISFGSKKSNQQTAEEIVKLISGLKIKRMDSVLGIVTVSLGYTADNSRYEKMIDKADIAMYDAKKKGKNQAVCFDE